MKKNTKVAVFIIAIIFLVTIAWGAINFSNTGSLIQNGNPVSKSETQEVAPDEEYVTYLQATVHATVVAITPNPEEGTLAAGFLDVEILKDDGELTEESARVVLSPFLKLEGVDEATIAEGTKISIPNAHVLSTDPEITILAETIRPLNIK